MKAVIMAGGEGTRLRPLTSNQPKPLMPLVNRPMMEHVVHLLKEHGFDDVVVTLAFLPQTIRTYFGDGSAFGVRMVYATEETPLGTAGSVRNARAELGDAFLVISGDVLTDFDLSALVAFHKEKGAIATIALKSMENPLEFGIVITREDGSIERFLEKPTWGQVFSDTVNTGIYVLEPEVFDYIPEGESVDFSSDVFPRLLADGQPLFGYVAEGYWEDVGTLEAYHKAHQDVLDGKVAMDIPGFRMAKGVWLGEGAEVDPDASIEGPAVIGDYCRVEAGASIREYTVLGANVMVRSDAFLERAVVHDNAYLSQGVRLRGSVVGRSCDLRAHARCEEGVVLGDNCFVGEHAVINAGVKVYPFKTVEPNAIINSSIVWESRGTRSLFGHNGMSGLANVDMTPELAVRVAMAYGTTMKKGSTVTTSRDSSRAARALKRAVMAGLNSAGINVDDLEMATVPVSRFQVRIQRSQGGITVRLTPGDPQSVTIRFFTADGTDIDAGAQRKIERIFFRQDFRRAFAADIGDIGYPPRALEYYSAALMETVDGDVIRSAGYQLVMDYAFGPTSLVMANVFSKLGADVLSVNPYTSTAGAAAFDAKVHASRVADLVRSSGPPGGGTRSRRRAHHPGRRRGSRPLRRAGPPGHGDHGRHRDDADRPAGVCDLGRRAHRHRGGGGGGLDQGLGAVPDGRGRLGRDHPGRQSGRRLHLPRLPARLRRHRRPGEAAGAAGPLGTAAVEDRRRAAPGPRRPRERRHAVGAEGPGHAPGGGGGQGQGGGPGRRGQGDRG